MAELHLHFHDHCPEHLTRMLADILSRVTALQAQGVVMERNLDDLSAQVKATTDVEQSALVLINGIAERLAEAGTDPAKLDELRISLKTSADSLAAAVVANTPPA